MNTATNLAKNAIRMAKDTILTNPVEGSNVLESYNMVLKSTGRKDARTTAEFSIQCNHMMKRNEQGVWQKRFVCIVPHLFLYYFDSDQSDSPRGVIDLEYFTNCHADGDNVLTLSADESVPLRSYYFQIDDPTVLGDWMTAVQRERYNLVKEERDMYHSMQLHFSSEMEEKNKNINAKDNEKIDMERIVADANQQTENAFNTIKRLLAVVAVNDDSLIDPVACDSIGPAALALEKGVNELRANLSKEVLRVAEIKGKEHSELNQELDAIADTLRLEKKAKEDAQKQAIDVKEKYEIQMAEMNNKIELLRKQNEELKFGGKIAEENAIKEVSTLTDQKKVLVKEVKQCRKKTDSLTELLNSMTTEKEEALNKLASSEKTCDELLEKMKDQDTKHAQAVLALKDMYEAKLSETKKELEAMELKMKWSKDSSSAGADPLAFLDTKDYFKSTDNQKDVEEILTKTKSGDDNNLLDLDWLTEEQRKKMEERSNDSRGAGLDAVDRNTSTGRSAMNMLQTVAKRVSVTSISSLIPSRSKDNSSPTAFLNLRDENGDASDNSDKDKTAVSSPFNSPSFSSSSPSSSPASKVLICLHCKGTVEGPLYSTCKCKEPCMTDEDLRAKNNTYIGGFMNFVKKGTEKLSIATTSIGSSSGSSSNIDNSNSNNDGNNDLIDGKQSSVMEPFSPNGGDLYNVFPGQSAKEEVQVYSQPILSDAADDKLGEERLSEDIQKRGDRKLSIENVKV